MAEDGYAANGITGTGIAVGMAFGVAMGVAMGDLAIGIAVGLALGAAFEAAFGAEADDSGETGWGGGGSGRDATRRPGADE